MSNLTLTTLAFPVVNVYLWGAMKDLKRRFVPGRIHQCYQNTINGGLLFYSISDYLVLFTIINLAAERYDVKIVKMCFMPDHLHGAYAAACLKNLSLFVGYYTSEYAVEFNDVCGRRGPLFNSPFGSAPKVGAKKVRTNLIYLDNNPVERKLVMKAEDYRWNFLAYSISDHPFSAPVLMRKASQTMKNAMSVVRYLRNQKRPLTYRLLHNWFTNLSKGESLQLVDFIITTYSVIDYAEAVKYFGSYESMLISVHANTGSEYDIKETFVGRNDSYYARMAAQVLKTGRYADIHEVVSLDMASKMDLFNSLLETVPATPQQVAKFLHMDKVPVIMLGPFAKLIG